MATLELQRRDFKTGEVAGEVEPPLESARGGYGTDHFYPEPNDEPSEASIIEEELRKREG